MSGRLAIDFGTSNTVVAIWDEAREEGVSLHIPDISQPMQYEKETIWVIPSLINYSPEGKRWLGQQVMERNLCDSNRTFKWMKRYIAMRNPARLFVDEKSISYFEAGQAFLQSILLFAAGEIRFEDEEVAFTVPVEAFEHYENWLARVAENAGMHRFRLIDEPLAAALGYGARVLPSDVYLIFDFGGGTLDVSVVLIEENDTTPSGRRCRVLGKAGEDLGGMAIDQWLFEEVLKRNGLSDSDESVRPISRTLLAECERAKERLSFFERAEVCVMNPDTNTVIGAQFSREEFEEKILDAHDFLPTIDRTIRRALRGAWARGYSEDDIKAVFMVGGCSLIPCVQRAIQRFFGKERGMLKRPLDAVARGAAAFVAGVEFDDHIQHDYAIRYVDTQHGEYQYHTIVKHGTPYPTESPVGKLTVKSTHEGQEQLGIAIFEVGERGRKHRGEAVELVFDPSGAARVVEVSHDEEERRTYFWMNENTPTFLTANPPAKRGAPRFEVEFNIDDNKRLLITARDVKTGKTVMRDYPVVKLT